MTNFSDKENWTGCSDIGLPKMDTSGLDDNHGVGMPEWGGDETFLYGEGVVWKDDDTGVKVCQSECDSFTAKKEDKG